MPCLPQPIQSFGAGSVIVRRVRVCFVSNVTVQRSTSTLAVTAKPSPDTRAQVAEKFSPLDVFHDKVKLRVVQKVAKPMYVRLQSRSSESIDVASFL